MSDADERAFDEVDRRLNMVVKHHSGRCLDHAVELVRENSELKAELGAEKARNEALVLSRDLSETGRIEMRDKRDELLKVLRWFLDVDPRSCDCYMCIEHGAELEEKLAQVAK